MGLQHGICLRWEICRGQTARGVSPRVRLLLPNKTEPYKYAQAIGFGCQQGLLTGEEKDFLGTWFADAGKGS